MRDETRTKIETVFREVFDNDNLRLSDNPSSETLATWDSLAHIRLVSSLEDELALTFTLEEIEGMTSATKILAVVESKV